MEGTLDRRIVANPTYDEQGKSPCDDNTRVEVLEDIKKWVHDISSSGQSFLWLTGNPGCGKSAVTASLARYCEDEGILWAQFFINRNNVETTNPNAYFPSIARQLADRHPDVERAVHERLKERRTLANYISSDQAAALFIDTLAVASSLDPKRPIVVTIDALDETDRKRLEEAADIFSLLFEKLANYPNVKVFLSSRTEMEIQSPFSRNIKDKHVKHIHLHTRASFEDVALFLRRKIHEIVAKHDLNWDEFPGEEGMEKLAARASGLFIWAATAAKFFQEQIKLHGTEGLRDLLCELTADALDDINSLYSLILRTTYIKHANEWDFEKFRRIVGAIIVMREPLSLEDLGELLDLRRRSSSDRVDILNFTRQLRTVLVPGTGAIKLRTVPRMHKSFFEFVTSQQVESRFRVDCEASEAELGLRCLHQFQHSYNSTVGRGTKSSSLPRLLQYACQFWSSHLSHPMGWHGLDGLICGPRIDIPSLRQLLHVPSRHLSPGPLIFSCNPEKSQLFTTFGVNSHLWDMKTGSEAIPPPGVLTGHKDGVSCFAFSPDGNRLVSGSKDLSLILWDVQTGKQIGSLISHTDHVITVAFSPSGRQIASGSQDKTIRLWDSDALCPISVLKGHTSWIESITFSPDGTILASCSDDKTVRRWSTQSSKQTGSPMNGHTSGVRSVAFTPDGQQIISGSWDATLRVWDSRTGQSIGGVISTPNIKVRSVGISPTGNHVVACGDGGICSWTRNGKNFVHKNLPFPKQDNAGYVILSSNGRSVAVNLSEAPHLTFFDLQTGQSTSAPANLSSPSSWRFALSPGSLQVAWGHKKDVIIWDRRMSFATPVSITQFSPDGTHIVSVFTDYTVWLWDTRSVPPDGKSLVGADNIGKLEHITFSSDNRSIAGVTHNSLHLWDVSTCKLTASGTSDNFPSITNISFSADRRTLITTHMDQTMHAWDSKISGKLVVHSIPLPADVALDTLPIFEVDKERSIEIKHGPGSVQWLPAEKEGFGFWAYLDGYLIRARRDGTVMVLPVPRVVPTPSTSLTPR